MIKFPTAVLVVVGVMLCGPIQSRAQNLPDFRANAPGWTGQPVAGQNLTLTMTVTNIGTGGITNGNWSDQWILSTNTSVSGVVPGGALSFYCYCARTVPTNGSYGVTNTFKLPNVPAGNYHLIAVANPFADVAESNSTNNASTSTPITLGIPDLKPTDVGWIGQPVAGQYLTLTMTVTNIGNGAINNNNWSDQWVLSTNTSVSGVVPGGVLSTYCYCARSVPINGSYGVTNAFRLPNVPAGNYYLIAVANPAPDVFESSYANNASSPATPITLGIPDLKPTDVGWIGQPVAGQYLTLTMTVTNIGNGAINNNNWSDQWVLSTNTSVSGVVPGGVLSTYCYCARSVPTNGSYGVTNAFRLPNVPAGNYYLIAVANPAPDVFESSYANNASSPATPITLGIPDLKPTDVGWIGQPVAGQYLTLTMTVTNIGNGAINNNNWSDQWVLSTNTSVSGVVPGGVLSTYCYCARSVPINGSYGVTNAFRLPNVPAGNYYLIAVANPAPDVFESSYANNASSPATPITLGIPDLKPTDVGWIGQPVAGQYLTLTMTVTNIGNGAINNNNWSDQWVLSTNTSVSGVVPGGVLSTYCYCARSVPTNGSYGVTNAFRLPNVPAGNYYLIAVANPAPDVFESSYANNASSPATPITLGIPDLKPTDVGWIGQPIAGQYLTLTMTVTNIGNGAINNNNWSDQWVLSTNTSVSGVVPGGVLSTYCYCARSVPTNGSYGVTNAFILPSVPDGTYYLFAVANPLSEVFESSYANNASAPPLALTIGNTDLIATNLSINEVAVAGTNLSVSFTVANISSNAYSGYWFDGITLSTNATLAGAITNWDWYNYHSLPPGSSYVQNQTIPLPGVAAGANYYLIAQADDRNYVSEANSSNNLQVLQITITNRAPVINLLAPVNFQSQTSCVPVSFSLVAIGQLGSYAITNVEFYVGATPIGNNTNPPYGFTSPLLGHGDHSITVQAADQFGLRATSQVATVSVRWPGQLHVLRADLMSSNCVICMAAIPGSNYLVQTTTNLHPPIDWQSLVVVTNLLNGSVLVVTNQRTSPALFYRTRVYP